MGITSADETSLPDKGSPPFGPDRAFFLDVDGTLLKLADRPDQVVVQPGLTGLLRELSRAAGGALALISGRTISDLDRLFSPLALPAAGQHGLERRDSEGGLHHYHQLDGRLDQARERLQHFADENPGILLEDKQFSIAIHYRQAPEKESLVTSLLEDIIPGLEDAFHLQKGKMILEIKPSGRNKGMAIREFMQEAPFHGRVPVFIGDDVTDEDGFDIVNNMHGYSVKVGDGKTSAEWNLTDTEEVLDYLKGYISRMSSRQQGQQ